MVTRSLSHVLMPAPRLTGRELESLRQTCAKHTTVPGRRVPDFLAKELVGKRREVRIIRVDSSVVIDRPPEEVFAYATDPAHTPEWQSSALETTVDGPVQAGAAGKELRKFLGRRMESTMRIEAFEPPRRFALQVTSGPVPFHVEQTVEPEGTGSLVSVTIEGEPGGFFKLADPLVERAVRRELEGNLATLKDILETRD